MGLFEKLRGKSRKTVDASGVSAGAEEVEPVPFVPISPNPEMSITFVDERQKDKCSALSPSRVPTKTKSAISLEFHIGKYLAALEALQRYFDEQVDEISLNDFAIWAKRNKLPMEIYNGVLVRQFRDSPDILEAWRYQCTALFGAAGADEYSKEHFGVSLTDLAIPALRLFLDKVTRPAIGLSQDPSFAPPFEAFILQECALVTGEYDSLSPFDFWSCIEKTSESCREMWLVSAIDVTIQHLESVGHCEPSTLYRLKGEILLEHNQKAEALACFRTALELNPAVGVKRITAKLTKELEAGN
ncbi:MAG: tetratricopeptide repeat protein [Oscillospiraceae bacterium]|jgi:hypothetical protein|nr:tetratricopeptide repeat protein [Oscillospiraceae bacterium]